MEGYFDLMNNESSRKLLKQKLILSSRKKLQRSPERSRRGEPVEKSDETTDQSTPVDEEHVLKKLKRERKLLKKWTVELNQAKDEIRANADIADEFSSVDSKISEIQKRYQILLPAIQLAMETMQANFSKSSSNCGNSKHRPINGGVSRPLKRSMEDTEESAANKAHRPCKTAQPLDVPIADSETTLVADFTKWILARRMKNQHRSTRNSSVAMKPGANGELLAETNLLDRMKQSVKMKDTYKPKSVTNDEVLRTIRTDQSRKRMYEGVKKAKPALVSVKNKHHSSPNFRKVEQNVLCTRPLPRRTESTPSFTNDASSDIGFAKPPQSLDSLKSSTPYSSRIEQVKCKCKNKIDPCICKCFCLEMSSSELEIQHDLDFPSAITWNSASSKRLESMQVQTSFPSSIAPCKPDTCPKRKKRLVANRDVEVQTDDTDIEWQYEPDPTRDLYVCRKRNVTKKIVASPFKIPPKRTETMDDRLQRRITYFDCHQSSVCNKNVQFCTYSVHQTKKGFPKTMEKVPCQDCPGSRKCNLVFKQHPYHLTCNEVVVEVKSLELSPEGVDCLKKVCSFLYIDYVFLGHVGNETNLAPVSSKVLFDSRKSYSVSLRFNKKERSILREQFNPSGLLVKDSIMFIIVCQAAPELDINKNWDFGFGYLSMKQIGEQMGAEDKMSATVEMLKIGGTKNNVGKLVVTIEGLKTVKSIMNEQLHCLEPRVDAVMKKLKLNQKELIAAENNQTTCKRRKNKN